MDDLEHFRKQWLAELQHDKSDEKKTDEIKNKKRKLSDRAEDSNNRNSPSPLLHKRSKTHILPTAFDIANKYLSVETSCKYCEEEYKKQNNRCCCRKAESSTEPDSDDNKNDSKLYELLIADFDEVNSIPFFDLELPREIAVKIFQYLSLEELINCSLVNSKWKILSADDLIWFNLCKKLDIDVKGRCVSERSGWKEYVKEHMIDRHAKRKKWKERLCEIRELENEKGGIICAADIHERNAVIAYIDGSIRLWNLQDATFGDNLKERYTNDEEIVLAMCTTVKLLGNICVAGFKNGDLMIWKLLSNFDSSLDYVINYDAREILTVNIDTSCEYVSVELRGKQIILKHVENAEQASGNWEQVYESYHESVTDIILLNSVSSSSSFQTLMCLPKQLILSTILPEENRCVLDEIVGASFTCVDWKNIYIVSAVSSIGYSVLDGYRIRRYNIESGRQISNLIGSQTSVTCLSYKSSHDEDIVVVGCSDATIKIHSFKSETMLLTIHGIASTIRTLQLDKWKIVSGHEDGAVCLYDSTSGFKYWQTNMRHPVHMCTFDDTLLACVAIPHDKSPQNSYWNAHDLIQRKKFRGTLCVMDFSKDVYEGIPQEFRADYDNIAGYDYNIDLIAPYDDVTTFNLPKI